MNLRTVPVDVSFNANNPVCLSVFPNHTVIDTDESRNCQNIIHKNAEW